VLFNSYEFLLVFLPITLLVFFAFMRFGMARGALAWLLLASLVFYSWWEPAYLPLLIASILFNYYFGQMLQSAGRSRPGSVSLLLAIGVGANLALLIAVKYTAFVVNEAAAAAGLDFFMRAVALPLGISFYTFTQIAYLVDSVRGRTQPSSLLEYALFVVFFPHLIAGPIVHHYDVLGQFRTIFNNRANPENFSRGLAFFSIGLFKKVVVADNLAPLANKLFDQPEAWASATAVEAWIGILAYTFQLYFDFSGYSDMAIGLALLFGIRFAYNFASPYKATSIIDFWRRWHITLSRFLRDYLYFSLGGNRRGPLRRHVNLFLTMLLGGIWHGANWTFLVWGALHGAFLIINHGWRALRSRLGWTRDFGLPGLLVARTLTLIVVMAAWVFFRAPSLQAAGEILQSAAGAHGLGTLQPALAVAALIPIVWLLPNSQEFVDGQGDRTWLTWRWKAGYISAAALAACLLLSVSQMSKVSVFIYFQF
jgi:alginate O-acetyltransferase complex protein AlgI